MLLASLRQLIAAGCSRLGALPDKPGTALFREAGSTAGGLPPAAAGSGGRTFRLVLKRPSRGFCAGSSFFLGGICRGQRGRCRMEQCVPPVCRCQWLACSCSARRPLPLGQLNYAHFHQDLRRCGPSDQGAIAGAALSAGRPSTLCAGETATGRCLDCEIAANGPTEHPPPCLLLLLMGHRAASRREFDPDGVQQCAIEGLKHGHLHLYLCRRQYCRGGAAAVAGRWWTAWTTVWMRHCLDKFFCAVCSTLASIPEERWRWPCK